MDKSILYETTWARVAFFETGMWMFFPLGNVVYGVIRYTKVVSYGTAKLAMTYKIMFITFAV